MDGTRPLKAMQMLLKYLQLMKQKLNPCAILDLELSYLMLKMVLPVVPELLLHWQTKKKILLLLKKEHLLIILSTKELQHKVTRLR